MHGHEYYVDTDNLSEFVWIESEDCYYHQDDVSQCPICGKHFVCEDGIYSDVTENDYCSNDCADKAEKLHKQKYWHFSQYDNDYYEDEDDITTFNEWNQEQNRYVRKTIHIDSLRTNLIENDWRRYGDEYFDEVDIETNLLFGYTLTLCA